MRSKGLTAAVNDTGANFFGAAGCNSVIVASRRHMYVKRRGEPSLLYVPSSFLCRFLALNVERHVVGLVLFKTQGRRKSLYEVP